MVNSRIYPFILGLDFVVPECPRWDEGFIHGKMSKIKRAKAKARKKLLKKLRKKRH